MTGPPDLSARGAAALGLLALALLLAGFGGWAATGRLEGAIHAPGRLEVERNRQVVQHPDGGVVAALMVRDGQSVKRDQVLLRLDAGALFTDLAIVETQLFETLARRGRLQADRDGSDAPVFDAELEARAAADPAIADLIRGQRALFAAGRDRRRQESLQRARRAAQAAHQLDALAAQVAATSIQAALLDQDLDAQHSLAERGLARADRTRALTRERAALAGRLGELAAARAEAEGRLTDIELDRLAQDGQRHEAAIASLRDLAIGEATLRRQRDALSMRIARLDLRAPAAGIVLGMTVFADRAVLRPAEPALYIIPQDRPLIVASRVPPIHGDEVWPGQAVALSFPALDRAETPVLTGRVRSLSPDLITDPETGARFYRAEIELPPAERARLGPRALLPGMPVEAFIRTRDRTLLAYLLDPVARFVRRAFRES